MGKILKLIYKLFRTKISFYNCTGKPGAQGERGIPGSDGKAGEIGPQGNLILINAWI